MNAHIIGQCRITQSGNACKVWLGDVFCPRLSPDHALILARKINELYNLRGELQARIRLASYCITSGVNE